MLVTHAVSLQNTSPPVQTADPEPFQKTIVEKEHLLGRHQQVLAGGTLSLESQANQQSKQQAQLVQLVASVKDYAT